MEPSLNAAAILRRTCPLPPLHPRRAQDLRNADWSQAAADAAVARLQGRAALPQRRHPPQVPSATPLPPPEWTATANFLANLVRSPEPPPSWWETQACFRATFQTCTDPRGYAIDARSLGEGSGAPAVRLQLTLAGWGHFRLPGEGPQRIGPGKAFLAADSSAGSHYLPEGSTGWTFVRIDIYHPYLTPRLMDLVGNAGSLLDLRPHDALTASVLRLVRGALTNDFRDQFEAELAVFDLALTLERRARQSIDGTRTAERLMDDVRLHVLATLPAAIEVGSLAARFGMSRSYFSYCFRQLTGITPAHFATEVRIQQVEHLLLDSREPLKTIAAACGFANANHLCKVFRRFRHHTPTSFRQALRPSGLADTVDRGDAKATTAQLPALCPQPAR
jgi:AraC-like DNA-binding protein